MPKAKYGKKMPLITVHVPEEWLQIMDTAVKLGYAPNRSELIRYALKEYFERHGLIERGVAEEVPFELLRGRV